MTAVILCVYLVSLCVAVAKASQQPHDRTVRETAETARGHSGRVSHAGLPVSLTVSNTGYYRGRPARFWYRKYVWMRHVAYQRHLKAQRARRALLASPSVTEAIELAAATYGNRSLLWNIAACETGGTFSPTAANPSSDATGLFQFMPGTFRSTPYGGLSIWSPYASAMAAGWMFTHGRRGEWVC